MFVIAEFGSVYRKSNDLFSDKDLLVICEKKYAKYYHTKYTKKGYSVSVFSERQLQLMKSKGSLFLQHLKLESRTLVDIGCEFNSFIQRCDLIFPSDHELSNCRKTLENLYSWPNNLISLGWKADFLYGVSRDYLIKTLAKNGVIAFGLESLIDETSILLSIPKSKLDALRSLREIKSIYRSDDRLPKGADIENAINSWYKLLKNEFNLNLSNTKKSSIISMGDFTSSYERLRYLEILYMSLVTHGFYHENHNEIVNFILTPNLYQSLSHSKMKLIGKYYNEVNSIYSKLEINNEIKSLQSRVLLRHQPNR